MLMGMVGRRADDGSIEYPGRWRWWVRVGGIGSLLDSSVSER